MQLICLILIIILYVSARSCSDEEKEHTKSPVTFSDEKSHIPESLEFDQRALEKSPQKNSLGIAYLYLESHAEETWTTLYQQYKSDLENGIAENVRNLKNVKRKNKNDYVAILKGLDYFREPMPRSAFVIQSNPSSYRYSTSPLEIKTAANANYVVKLVDVATKETEILFFVPANSRYEVQVPSGEYELRYMSGDTWYGEKILFGKDCSCAAADKTFYFSYGSGYTVTLYKVLNGNLRTSTLDATDF